ncbi:MAG: sigma-70 family RNA polymerase sigma factor [Lachnospiraceae bacterium]|nr:sigma-70 family RNA polymerase sigma factor [Lachnospiraceae bacterium]
MNDKRTISAIRYKDEAVINEVIKKYSKLLWSVSGAVLSGIGSVQDVEECVADTFIYLWEHPDKYNPERGKLKTWLSIIARTQAINRCREITKRDTVPLEDIGFIDHLGVVDDILKEEVRRTLIAAINALGEPEREILIRRYYYEQRPREIALALDMSTKQVDNRLYQTKLKLREALSD